MAAIVFNQAHSLPPEAARAAAQQMAERIARDFGISYAWEGNVLKFSQAGVAGALALLDGDARLQLELSGMMSAFAPMIEEKLARKMRELFSA
jgi:putative polyhydroxyalkanoate system protein